MLGQAILYADYASSRSWAFLRRGWSEPERPSRVLMGALSVPYFAFLWTPRCFSGSKGQRSAEAAASITNFLRKTYWSMGETLPHERLGFMLRNLQTHLRLRLEVDNARDLNTKEVRLKLLQALVDSALESDLAQQGLVQAGPEGLPRRWLPHGVYHDLYTLYCSHQLSAGERVASCSTFYRVLSASGWKKKIKFSAPSSHSKCTICQKLRSRIHHAKGIQEHTESCDLLLRHLAGQYQDRQTYYECRCRAKAGEIVCAITDSMDKSKYALPRWHRGRAPKDLETTKRPSLEVTTTMIHGVGIYTYLSDEDQTSGTNWVLETLNRSFQHMHEKHQRDSKPVPGVVRIFADNTPKVPCFHEGLSETGPGS